MQCPKCQADVSDGHFYCSNCHAQVQTYEPEVKTPSRGRFERAGFRLLHALLWVAIIFGLVWVGRRVMWRELIAAIRGETGLSVKAETESKANPASHTRSDKSRHGAKTPKAANDKTPKAEKVVEAAGGEKNDPAESPPTAAQKVEKLPAAQDQPQSPKPVEQVGAKNSDQTVLIISSITPARVYINGQYSGITPRTIKLNPGDHQVRLIADGYEEWTRRVRLKTNQRMEISASMKMKDSQKE